MCVGAGAADYALATATGPVMSVCVFGGDGVYVGFGHRWTSAARCRGISTGGGGDQARSHGGGRGGGGLSPPGKI